ncbi:MAG: hypothetical protein EXR72_01645 [Myxococcales bacterium]|nr:hypothetical protein [Myxococcales bacterium]
MKDQRKHETIDQLKFNGVKIFSATMAQERERLGEKVTMWLDGHREARVVDKVVTQSSDEQFHCLAITLFFWEER